MNGSESSTIETISGAMGVGILLVCIALWAKWLKSRRLGATPVSPAINLTPWSRSWVDFMIVLWCSVMVYVALVTVIRFLLPSGYDPVLEMESGNEVSWFTILYSSAIQLALLITVVGSKVSFKFNFFEKGTLKASAWFCGFDRLIRYMPLLWLSAGVSIWLTRSMGISSGEQEAVTMMQGIENPFKFAAMAGLAIVAAPILEELFFRGLVLRFLVGYVGKNGALILSALFFGILHFNTDSFLPIAILGFMLGKAYLDTGNLKTSIWMHFFFNAQSLLVIALDRLFF